MPRPSITAAYEDFIWSDGKEGLASRLYGTPPKTFGGIYDRLSELLREYEKIGWHSHERMKKMKSALSRINRDLGILTPKVKSNIENLHHGAIEAAHQPVVLGGPAFILNKAATAERIAALNSLEEHRFSPFFCVADYDIVQNELTHMRTPLMGSGGTMTSVPIPEGYEFSPIRCIPLPEYAWYEQVEEDIRAGYRPMIKALEGPRRSLFEERLESALALIRNAYAQSRILGEWINRILALLFNIHGNLGLPILPASDSDIRELWCLGMELLLQKGNRTKLIQVHGETSNLITSYGYETGIGARGDDYVPFYHECTNEGCHMSRTELSYLDHGTKAVLKGACPSCKEKIELEVDSNSPDLSEVASNISPRVDTRQMIIDTSLPILSHAGGPGETAYYAQVIPVANSLGFPFPLYVKYPRAYYNTPWNEALSTELQDKGYPVLHNADMFRALGKVSRSRNKDRTDDMNESLSQLASIIGRSYKELNATLDQIVAGIEQEGETTDETLRDKMDLERYLSWAFGQYAEGKQAQESSWAWLDWAINSGLSDLFGPYQRAYVAGMKHGAAYFVNFLA